VYIIYFYFFFDNLEYSNQLTYITTNYQVYWISYKSNKQVGRHSGITNIYKKIEPEVPYSLHQDHKFWDEVRRSGIKDVAEIRAWAGPRTRHCQKNIRDMSSSYFFFLVNYILIPTHSLVFHFGSHNLRCFNIDIMIAIAF
jgi:hypothetical protein